SVLECFAARLRSRVEECLWRVLGRITPEQKARLNSQYRPKRWTMCVAWCARLKMGSIESCKCAIVGLSISARFVDPHPLRCKSCRETCYRGAGLQELGRIGVP